jgi:hypothetical protein
VENQVVRILRERYADVGPTLTAEKLAEWHQITLAFYSDEALRPCRWAVPGTP